MHDQPFGFDYAYKAHHQEHHKTFGAGKTYELSNHPPEKRQKNRRTIPMAWWNWIVLLLIVMLPVVPVCLIFFSLWWPIIITATVFVMYYCTYEYLHWCMHDPQGRWFEDKRWFVWFNKRHRLHHKHVGKNFNVVLPLADLMLGTLILE
jgi:hypothetical protein